MKSPAKSRALMSHRAKIDSCGSTNARRLSPDRVDWDVIRRDAMCQKEKKALAVQILIRESNDPFAAMVADTVRLYIAQTKQGAKNGTLFPRSAVTRRVRSFFFVPANPGLFFAADAFDYLIDANERSSEARQQTPLRQPFKFRA